MIIPKFNPNETERVARIVGFNPLAGAARECLQDTKKVSWNFPDGLSDKQIIQVQMYVALGLFIWCKYGEQGQPIPDSVNDWYEKNTALTTFETFFKPVGEKK